MSKLFVFAIGGTGSRVLNSLTHILATGVSFNADEVIPMIIDTDVDNGNLEDCRDAIKLYNSIHEQIFSNVAHKEKYKTDFFRTKIHSPRELNVSGRNYGTLRDMIGYDTMVNQGPEFARTKQLIDLLFPEKQLNMELEKGFLGNPNVGSIVLNNVVKSEQFKSFTQEFKAGDRIFIISSIFGGTGAAGFPLLLKIFRNKSGAIQNDNLIGNAIIGGITVLPYFSVKQNPDSAIDSNAFISKTKAALHYYNKNVVDLLNCLYYIGDTKWSNFENVEGGRTQKNAANFIEFASALSIIDFVNYEKGALKIDDLSQKTSFFQFGIGRNDNRLTFKHISGSSEDDVISHLIKFSFFGVYASSELSKALSKRTLAWRKRLKLPSNFEDQPLVKDLKAFFMRSYFYWLKDLDYESHGRRFFPFKLNFSNGKSLDSLKSIGSRTPAEIKLSHEQLINLVNDKSVRDVGGKIRFDDYLTRAAFSKDLKSIDQEELRFMRMANLAFNTFYDERIKGSN